MVAARGEVSAASLIGRTNDCGVRIVTDHPFRRYKQPSRGGKEREFLSDWRGWAKVLSIGWLGGTCHSDGFNLL